MDSNWINLDTINDGAKSVFAGTVVRIYDKTLFSQEGYYDYLLTFVYGDCDVLQLTCLAKGEEGNITSVLCVKEGCSHTTVFELKRMMDGYDKVMINFQPTIEVH